MKLPSTKCIPGFIGGLYGTFYYNLGDDSFLYIGCYTAGPLRPVNVQRGPGSAVGTRGCGIGPAPRPAPPRPLSPWIRTGKTQKKVKRQERLKGVHAPPFRSGVGFPVHGESQEPKALERFLSSAGGGCRAQPAQHSVCLCICVKYAQWIPVCVLHVGVCAGVNLRRFPAASRLGREARWAGAGSLLTLAHSFHT